MTVLIILVASLVSSCLAQTYHRSSQDAAILSDARYLAGDGTFGAAYTQEDGVEFKEESDVNGDRKGSYSYVDPTGNRRTVFYTAGRNGFQVRDELKATGDHIPTAAPVVAPQPEYEPLPEYNPPDYRSPYQPQRHQYSSQAEPRSHHAQESIYQYHPEPRHYPESQYRSPSPPSAPPQPQYRPEPQQHYRPQYRSLLAFQPDPAPVQPQPQFQYEYGPRYEPQTSARPQYQPLAAPRPRYNDVTTPTPRRFYPPGKLDFNRTPDGFSYTFSKS